MSQEPDVRAMVALAVAFVDEAAAKTGFVMTPAERFIKALDFLADWLAKHSARSSDKQQITIDWGGVKL